jgi:hypothetical protein
MKKKSIAEKEKSLTIRSSIAVSSEVVCEDEACIGKVVNVPSPVAHEAHTVSAKQSKQSDTAMSFGGKEGCTDEACIGKS